MKNRILLLEDDIDLNETISEYLEDNGFEVVSVYDGEEALEKIYESSYDILLLDVKVPKIDGFNLLKEIRKAGNETPAIYITSLDSIEDLSIGYESGCDDYIRKPFELKELLIRIQSIIKRNFTLNHSSKVMIDKDKNIYFDLDANTLYKGEKSFILNQKETRLLKYFLKHKNKVLSHEKIFNAIWDYDESPSESSLRTYIKNLRKIIGKDKIVSIKKVGYKFTSD